MEPNRKIKIHKNWALAWFKEWIKDNDLSSVFEQDKKNTQVFYFKNVTRQLEIWIRRDEIVVAAINRKACWDMLRCSDLGPAKNSKGYYCSWCNVKPVQYHKSLKKLYIHHNCDELLAWYKEIVIPENNLYLMGLPGRGGTWAKVTTEGRLGGDRDYIIKTIPLYKK